MKVLSAAQMREVDRRTIELGIPSLILMENAAHRVVEFLVEKFAPLERHRIVILCGKGNNGGDGLAIARQLRTRFQLQSLDVVLAADPEELRGDAAENLRMLHVNGVPTHADLDAGMRRATIVVDALLGTGLSGPAKGRYAELIREVNTGFPDAVVVAVDVPSGLESDSGADPFKSVSADYTVTFTAPKICQVLSPACDKCGELRIAQIGSPAGLYDEDSSIYLSLSEPGYFKHLFRPRVSESNKGLYGHVLVIAGARGKTGAAAMAGIAALRAGAGLVTVASAESAITPIASYAPEIMTEPLPETESGSIAMRAWDEGFLKRAMKGKNVIALGPGLGSHPETVKMIRRIVNEYEGPLVVDADGLNALAGSGYVSKGLRVFTPHPGEMSRLTGQSVQRVQAGRVDVARSFAREHGIHLVLKGNRSLIACPDGRVYVNPTGSPALATGGTGDVLTGVIAGLLAQFPHDLDAAVLAGVYVHGRAGEIGATEVGEKALIATDLFRFLPEAMHDVADLD